MSVVMLKDPIKELATPEPDGIAVIFFTTNNYVSNTLSVWVNGRKLLPESDNGYTELGGNQFMFNVAPALLDTVHVEYDIQ